METVGKRWVHLCKSEPSTANVPDNQNRILGRILVYQGDAILPVRSATYYCSGSLAVLGIALGWHPPVLRAFRGIGPLLEPQRLDLHMVMGSHGPFVIKTIRG